MGQFRINSSVTNMKFLVVVGCLSVVSAAPFYGLVAHPNGAVVPVDEPRVAAARAEHLAAKGVIAGPAVAPLGYAAGAPLAYSTGYAGPLNLNTQLVAHPNGAVVPVDEPAVVAARADHLNAKGAIAYAAPAVAAAPALTTYAGYAAVPALPALVAHPNGAVVPVDEPAVQEARAAHL